MDRCKEVAEGGVAFLLERLVTHRYVENTYGTPVSMHFNPFDSEHLERIESAIHTPVGLMLNGGFSAIMSKVSIYACYRTNTRRHLLRSTSAVVLG